MLIFNYNIAEFSYVWLLFSVLRPGLNTNLVTSLTFFVWLQSQTQQNWTHFVQNTCGCRLETEE